MTQSINTIYEHLEKKEYLDNPEDNNLLLQYLQSKEKGEYGSLQYGTDGNGCSEATLLKNAILIRQALSYIKKQIKDITREDAISLRDMLKKNEIKAIKWRTKKGTNTVEQYETQMTYSTKRTVLLVITQFWKWYQEYKYNEEKKEIPNIFERIKLVKPQETEHNIDWLEPEELKKLMKHLERHEDYRLFVAIAIDTAGRPLELANLRRRHFIYKGDKLFCKLPNIKGCSGRKHTNEVLYEKGFIESKIKNLNSDSFIFDFIDTNKPIKRSPNCYDWNMKKYISLTSRTKNYTYRIIGKRYTPYAFRKTSTMHWLRISNNDAIWVQKRLGHVEGSPQIKYYMSFEGIKTPEGVDKRLKDDKYMSVSEEMQTFQEENQSMKLQMEQMKQQMDMMQTQFLNTISKMPNINAVDNRDLIMQTIEAVEKKKLNKN